MRLYEQALIQYDWCPCRKKSLGHTQKERQEMYAQGGHLQAQKEASEEISAVNIWPWICTF